MSSRASSPTSGTASTTCDRATASSSRRTSPADSAPGAGAASATSASASRPTASSSTVVNGARQAAVFPGDAVAVLGAGPVGLMFVALLTLAGAAVVAVEPSAERAELARRLGAVDTVDPSSADVAARVRELGADVVVDAVGTQLPVALDVTRKGGRIVLFGVDGRARAEIAQEHITRDELTIVGSFVGQDVFPAAIRLLEQGRLDLEPLVTHRIGLEELPAAVDELRAGRAVKIEVEFA